MTATEVTEPRPAAPAPTATRPSWPQRLVILVLAAVWVACAVSWLLSPKPATWQEFTDALDRGDVESIQVDKYAAVVGDLDTRYVSTVRVAWKEGWHTYRATVTESSRHKGPVKVHEVNPDDDATHLSAGDGLSTPSATMHDLPTTLAEIAPDISVTYDGERSAGQLYERPVTKWVLVVGFIGILAAFIHLILAPPPAFATRWAWFWIIVVPIPFLGIAGYLTMLFFRRPGRQKPALLTGGWAFLFLMVNGAVLGLLPI